MNWLETAVEHLIMNEKYNNLRALAEKDLRNIAIDEVRDNLLPGQRLSNELTDIIAGNFKVVELKLHESGKHFLRLICGERSQKKDVQLDFDPNDIAGTIDSWKQDNGKYIYFNLSVNVEKSALIKAASEILSRGEFYPTTLPFDEHLLSRLDPEDPASSLKSLSESNIDDFKEIEANATFIKQFIEVQWHPMESFKIDQEKAQKAYHSLSRVDGMFSPFELMKLSQSLYLREVNRDKFIKTISRHFPEKINSKIQADFIAYDDVNFSLGSSQYLDKYRKVLSNKSAFEMIMEIDGIEAIKQYGEYNNSKFGSFNTSEYVSGRLFRNDFPLVIEIIETKTTPYELMSNAISHASKTFSEKLNGLGLSMCANLAEYIGEDFSKQAHDIKRKIESGFNIASNKKPQWDGIHGQIDCFNRFADLYESLTQDEKALFQLQAKQSGFMGRLFNEAINEYNQFFEVVSHQMRGGKIMDYAEDHGIKMNTLKAYASRHRKFQIALCEETDGRISPPPMPTQVNHQKNDSDLHL